MPKSPLISIITVNLNNLEGLKKTMKSVFEQSWQEFEYIIIDGGSSDGSREFIEAKKDKIDYWVSEPDKGIYNAMNKRIKAANGEYLYFLNSGDNLNGKDILNQVKDKIKLFDLIYFNIDIIKGETKKNVSYPSKLRFTYFINATLCHQAILIRKELFLIAGKFDENLSIVSDWKFLILTLFKHNCTYLKVDQTLSTFYLDGISSNPKNFNKINKEKEDVLNEHFSAILPEMEELKQIEFILRNLRKSKKINLLIKLGMLKKF